MAWIVILEPRLLHRLWPQPYRIHPEVAKQKLHSAVT